MVHKYRPLSATERNNDGEHGFPPKDFVLLAVVVDLPLQDARRVLARTKAAT